MINEKIYNHKFNFYNGRYSSNQKIISNLISKHDNKVIINSSNVSMNDICSLRIGDWSECISLNDFLCQCNKLYLLCKSKKLNLSIDLSFNSRKIDWISGNSKIEKKSIIRIAINKGRKDYSFIDIPFVLPQNRMLDDIEKACTELICARTEGNTDIDLDICDFDIIMSPKATGYFIHEIIGHPIERDIVDNKMSFFSHNNMNTNVMPNFINIIEAPDRLKRNGYDFGTFDDEENVLKPIDIIKNGVLKNFIEYKRCSQFRYPCINRMHNLILKPNKKGCNLSKMIEFTKNGIVIDEIISGCYNVSNNQFVLYCGRCRYVKDGEVIGYDDGLIIKDNISLLNDNIVEIGNDFKTSIGMCAKQGQIITVGMGAPTMRLKNVNIQKGGTLCF